MCRTRLRLQPPPPGTPPPVSLATRRCSRPRSWVHPAVGRPLGTGEQDELPATAPHPPLTPPPALHWWGMGRGRRRRCPPRQSGGGCTRVGCVGAVLSSHYDPCISGLVAGQKLSPELCSLQCTGPCFICLSGYCCGSCSWCPSHQVHCVLPDGGGGGLAGATVSAERNARAAVPVGLGLQAAGMDWHGGLGAGQPQGGSQGEVLSLSIGTHGRVSRGHNDCSHMNALVAGGVIIGLITFSRLSGFLL